MIVTVAGAIEGKANDRLLAEVPVIRHDRCEVGVMVLHQDQLAGAGMCPGPGGAAVTGMSISDDHLGSDTGHLLEMSTSNVECLERRKIVHVTDMCAQPGISPVAHAEGVLQVRPDREG